MGEKLLAQRVLTLLRDTYGKSSREAEAALQWAQDSRDWLWPDRIWADPETGVAGDTIDWTSLASLAGDIDVSAPLPELFGTISAALPWRIGTICGKGRRNSPSTTRASPGSSRSIR